MKCLNCKEELFQYSKPITAEEQKQYGISEAERFVFCSTCGCVMIQADGMFCSTDHITDVSFIAFAKDKLFGKEKVVHYSLTSEQKNAVKLPQDVEALSEPSSNIEIFDISNQDSLQKDADLSSSKEESKRTLWTRFTSFVSGIFKRKAS